MVTKLQAEACGKNVEFSVHANGIISIGIQGYEDHSGTNQIIVIDLEEFDGQTSGEILVWADKSKQDPTHLISLRKAAKDAKT